MNLNVVSMEVWGVEGEKEEEGGSTWHTCEGGSGLRRRKERGSGESGG